MGDDADLVAPQLFKMRSQLTMVFDLPGLPSRGKLDLNTGQVTDLHYNVRNINTALITLFGVNPNLPAVGLCFPGPPNAGSTWARFDPREDGRLDFTFAGHMFLPLGLDAGGEPIRFALPFGTPDLRTASFIARGTSLHPHVHLTTRETPEPAPEESCPDVPFNTVQELTAFTRNTSFGDAFDLAIDEFGGPATGRSHLLGRVRLQIGAPSSGTVPVAVSVLPPGGLLSDDPANPPHLPPGVSRGMPGFDAQLEFPGATYNQRQLANSDDPFNLTIGNFDLRTGRVTDELLGRGYVVQKLFEHLLRAEPCTPADSFNYQGPASLEPGSDGGMLFRWNRRGLHPLSRRLQVAGARAGRRADLRGGRDLSPRPLPAHPGDVRRGTL